MKYFFIACLSIFIFSSCLDTDQNECGITTNFSGVNQDLLSDGIQEIDDFLADSSIVAIEDPSGLRYVINEEGEGVFPSLCNDVIVTYTGSILSNGEIFETREEPLRIPLQSLIIGWQIGLQKIKQGGSITLYIPSEFGYGEDGTDAVPANANLIFEIQYLR